MESILKWLDKTDRFKNLSVTDKKVMNEILNKCLIQGKITAPNNFLSQEWNIPVRSLVKSLKNLKEAFLIETNFERKKSEETGKWYCSSREIFFLKYPFHLLPKRTYLLLWNCYKNKFSKAKFYTRKIKQY